MKYKVTNGSETYNMIIDLYERVKEVKEAAREACVKLGFDAYYEDSGCVAGGIEALKTEDWIKPDGYTKHGRFSRGWCPYRRDKASWKILNELPRVTYDDMNKIIGFQSAIKGLTWYTGFTSIASTEEDGTEIFLIQVSDHVFYEPKDDMVEILGSEFKRLKARSKL